MKKFFLSAAAFAVVAVSAIAVAPNTAEAIPAFARQTGAACLNCHFQAFPRLATMGRNFSLGGMRDMGDGALLEDDGLSLPAAFNASFEMKVLINNSDAAAGTNGVPGADTTLMMPDEAALHVGGRLGANAGFLTEISVLTGTAGITQAKFDVVFDLDSGPLALVLGTGDHGAGWLFNDPSNAVRQNTRYAVERPLAINSTMMMNSAIAGIGFYTLVNDSIYFAAGLISPGSPSMIGNGTAGWTPSSTTTNAANTNGAAADLGQLSPYVRAALITEVAGLEAVIGLWYTNITPAINDQAAVTAAVATLLRASGAAAQYGLDVQLQGDVGDLSLGFYLPVVIKGEQESAAGAQPVTEVMGYNPTVTIDFGNKGLKFGYDFMRHKNIVGGQADKTSRLYAGGWLSLAQNILLELAYRSTTTKLAVGGPAAATAASSTKVNDTTLVIEYLY